jgi:hypothetical protein
VPVTTLSPSNPPVDPAGLSTWEALGLFAGIPAFLVVLIAGVVVLIERRSGRASAATGARTPAPPRLPRGIEPTAAACVVMADEHGHEVHHRADLLADGVVQPEAACWTARCTECGRHYREDDQDAHFRSGRHALAVVEARDWSVTAGRLRCSTCP